MLVSQSARLSRSAVMRIGPSFSSGAASFGVGEELKSMLLTVSDFLNRLDGLSDL